MAATRLISSCRCAAGKIGDDRQRREAQTRRAPSAEPSNETPESGRAQVGQFAITADTSSADKIFEQLHFCFPCDLCAQPKADQLALRRGLRAA
jgi:hypothetical protein